MRIIILLALSFISFLSRAQEQVSDVYFDKLQYPVSVGVICGFQTNNEVDYMIIDNDSLQIFELEEEEFILKNVVHIPKEFAYRIYGKVTNNSSQKSIEGKYYYMFFRNGILVVDLEEGTIHRAKDLTELNYRLYRVLKKTDDQIYFYGFFDVSGRGFFRYDVSSNKIYLLDEYQNEGFYLNILDHTHYYIDESKSNILGYDILNDSFIVKYLYDGPLVSGLTFRHNLGEEYATFRDQIGFKIIKKNGEIIAFKCSNNLPENTILAVRGKKYIVASKRESEDVIQVYNVDDCELLQEFEIYDDNYSYTNSFYINDNLIEDYTIIGYYGHYFGYGLGIVLDHTTNSASYSFNYDYVFPDAAVETDNAVYWIGYDEIELSPSYYYVMRYDKNTRQVASISPYENRIYSSSIGITKEDEIYFAANNYDNDFNIWKTIDGSNFSVAKPLDFAYNLGVFDRYDIRVDGTSVVSNGVGGMMITEDNTKLINSGANRRDMAITDDYIATVITEGGGNYVLKYDKQSGTAAKILLNMAETYQFKPVITDRFIFDSDPQSNFYFDISNETKKLLNHNSTVTSIDPSKFYHSQDKMIITEYTGFNSPDNYYIFDFETEALKKLNYDLPDPYAWIVMDNNVFYFDDSDLMYPNEEITRISDGKPPKIIYSGDCPEINMSNTPSRQSGEYAVLLFKCQEEVLIVSDDGESELMISLPNEGSFDSGNNIVHYNKDEYFFKSFSDGETKFSLFNAPNSMVHVDIPNTEWLISSSFDLEKPLLITLNEDEKTFRFYLLDKQSGELSLEMESTYTEKNYPRIIFGAHAVSSTQYLATVFHEKYGYELTEIDLEEKTFDLKIDFYEGVKSSVPRNYTRTQDYLYFIAELEDDGRQWFRIKADVLNSNQEIVIESLLGMNVFPNPANFSINTRIVLKRYSVYNIQGQEVLSDSNNASEDIKIIELPSGHYIISGADKNGILYSGKFVKVD